MFAHDLLFMGRLSSKLMRVVSKIKKNAVYNVALALSQVLFPLITFPYIARVLAPNGLGAVSFVDNYTQYFTLVAAMGIPIYGIREIAKTRDSLTLRSRIFSELMVIHVLLTSILALAYIVSYLFVPLLQKYTPMFWSGTMLLLSSAFVVEWCYQGLEKFAFITKRTIVLRIAAILAIFVFVKEPEDAGIYYAINCTTVLVSAVVNQLYLRKDVPFTFRGLRLTRHFKPLLYISSTAMVSSVYTLLDSVLLGFYTNPQEVGFYTTSVKISKLAIMVLSAISAVLVPSLSKSFYESRIHDTQRLLSKSFDYTSLIGVPLCIGLITTAEPLILVFSGSAFTPAILSLRILAPTVLLVGVSYIFGMQILNPSGSESLFFKATLIGMLVSICFNVLLIPQLHHIGTAISNLIVETIVMALLVKYSRSCINFKPAWVNVTRSFVAALPFFVIASLAHYFKLTPIIALLLNMLVGAFFYITIQYFVWKNYLLTDLFRFLIIRFLRN